MTKASSPKMAGTTMVRLPVPLQTSLNPLQGRPTAVLSLQHPLTSSSRLHTASLCSSSLQLWVQSLVTLRMSSLRV